MSDYFNEPQASELAKQRIKARNKCRITYDCLHAIVDGRKVSCNKGNRIGTTSDGHLDLVSVLRGRSAKVCQDCEDYSAGKVKATIIGKQVYD